MAKQTKEKRPKNPKDWPGAEKNHSLKVGDKVTVEHFGVEQKGWEVIEVQRHEATGLACYKLKDPNGTKWPCVGFWYNEAVHTKIL
jgi:hypothetical protein